MQSPNRLPTLLLLLLAVCSPGCALLGGSPSAANIQLRKEKQELEAKIARLETKAKSDEREIKGLRAQSPSLPTLPAERLTRLYTTHGIKLGRLTGGWDRDRTTAGDEGIKVYVVPLDEDGQPIKMTGAFTVELFDLAESASPLVGKWEFDVASIKSAWRGAFMDYTFVLECPWKDILPKHAELTLKVKFLDELTQTAYETQEVIRVNPPTK